jgi:uncharacterized Zn-binding protein involved in type VI secretion
MLNPGVPPPPHVGGPVTGPGVPTVLIGGKPAAVMGDMCTCAGPPDTIVQGVPTVLIGGKPAATMGSMTAHGGSITIGVPNVLLGTGGSGPSAVAPLNQIPFPEISFLLKAQAFAAGKAKALKEAEKKIEQIKKESEEYEPTPMILSVEFIDEESEKRISEGKMVEVIKIRAHTKDVPDGDTVTFKLNRVNKKDKNGNKVDDEDLITLTGTVKDNVAIIEYDVPYFDDENEV